MDTMFTMPQLEEYIWELTTRMLGYDPTQESAQDIVRINWPQDGAPAWAITDDKVFIQINSPDDPITYQRDTAYQPVSESSLAQEITYTRVHSVKWIFYGPNSYDLAEKVKNGLYKRVFKEQYNAKNLHLILDFAPPYRMPELFNGKWWQRADFSARFNEYVKLNDSTPTIASASVINITHD